MGRFYHRKIINNKIYVGDYERFKRVAKEQGKRACNIS